MKGIIKSINISEKRGIHKREVQRVYLRKDHGVEGDAHAGHGERQVSLLAWERVKEMGFKPGNFAENITTEGIDFSRVKVGNILKIGGARLKVSEIGKKCHTRCAIFKKVGHCIMPKDGVFAEVLKGGVINVGNMIEVIRED